MPIQASRKQRVGVAALAPGEDGGGGHQGGEDDPPGVDEEHQRVLQFVLDGLEGVGGEVLGELAAGIVPVVRRVKSCQAIRTTRGVRRVSIA